MRTVPAARAAIALAALLAARAWAETPRLVLLPFGNLSGVEGAPGAVAASLVSRLSEKGWDVARGEAVEELLSKERVRYVDSLGADARLKLLAGLSSEAVVSGTIYSFSEGDNAVFSLSARMVRANGSVAWSAVVSLTADETEGLLGLGRAASLDALASKALARLLKTFPAPGQGARARALATPFLKAAPPTYKAMALAGKGVRRVCLFPFENFTPSRDAPRVLADVLQHELVASGRFEVVEAADLRAALVAEKVKGLGALEPARLAALGRRLGTSLFLRGSVYRYTDPGPRGGSSTPEVDVDLALVDAGTGRTVWMGGNARRGRDYKGLFQLGALRSVVALSDQVFGEMVSAEGKATPKGFPAQLARAKKRVQPDAAETSVRAGRLGGAP